MRELHGVTMAYPWFLTESLKRRALLFDKLQVVLLNESFDRPDAQTIANAPRGSILADRASVNAIYDELEYLHSVKFLIDIDEPRIAQNLVNVYGHLLQDDSDDIDEQSGIDLAIRAVVCELEASNIDAVGLFQSDDGLSPRYINEMTDIVMRTHHVADIVTRLFPAPDDSCAWQDLFDFKSEMLDKLWHFRRFIHTLVTKSQTEAEIRDDIEWTVNEYTKAMALHHIKSAQSFVDVFVISPLDLIENLVKLNWSKIAKGALQVRRRKVELMEAEMKAPGRECAYVFDARKRFGG
jgi:hypothetical protein